jgi:hypothetical protein
MVGGRKIVMSAFPQDGAIFIMNRFELIPRAQHRNIAQLAVGLRAFIEFWSEGANVEQTVDAPHKKLEGSDLLGAVIHTRF